MVAHIAGVDSLGDEITANCIRVGHVNDGNEGNEGNEGDEGHKLRQIAMSGTPVVLVNNTT